MAHIYVAVSDEGGFLDADEEIVEGPNVFRLDDVPLWLASDLVEFDTPDQEPHSTITDKHQAWESCLDYIGSVVETTGNLDHPEPNPQPVFEGVIEDDVTDTERDVTVRCEYGVIDIHVEGYDNLDNQSAPLVAVGVWESEAEVLVWDEYDDPTPTKVDVEDAGVKINATGKAHRNGAVEPGHFTYDRRDKCGICGECHDEYYRSVGVANSKVYAADPDEWGSSWIHRGCFTEEMEG